ncbi:unnamed protein product [Arabidopsis arenosa]|uniref:Uncharacterized protein n=1 Tax=Arabidopsis arenosa TaxID=38785 RepID=A0A8S1ZSV2_ARAAE|nr:unnamed protein product [Arabidopsis arenosa]
MEHWVDLNGPGSGWAFYWPAHSKSGVETCVFSVKFEVLSRRDMESVSSRDVDVGNLKAPFAAWHFQTALYFALGFFSSRLLLDKFVFHVSNTFVLKSFTYYRNGIEHNLSVAFV